MVEIHHLVEANRRLGDDYTIPLCQYHHRGVAPDIDNPERIYRKSRHYHGRRAFEACWGSEHDLLTHTNEIMNAQFPA
jgi:hypothetical protein